jgi:hypothetical protein
MDVLISRLIDIYIYLYIKIESHTLFVMCTLCSGGRRLRAGGKPATRRERPRFMNSKARPKFGETMVNVSMFQISMMDSILSASNIAFGDQPMQYQG